MWTTTTTTLCLGDWELSASVIVYMATDEVACRDIELEEVWDSCSEEPVDPDRCPPEVVSWLEEAAWHAVDDELYDLWDRARELADEEAETWDL